MIFPTPLERGILVRRYKRFLADVILEDGTEMTVHVPNPGAMLGLQAPGSPVWLSHDANPKRKLPYTLQLIEVPDGRGEMTIVGLNTLLPNRLVAEALAAAAIPELAGYATVRPEVRYSEASRVDFLLEHPDRPPCWLEVKNCHLMREAGLAEFPDCVAARSTKHLRDLAGRIAVGDRAVVLWVVQRTDCETFKTCEDLDPAFSRALAEVTEAGVEVLVYACDISAEAITLRRRLEWLGR